MIELEFRGERFFFNETPTAKVLVEEVFADNYEVFSKEIPVGPGDVVLDLGANEGMFSIMMAKMFPMAAVYSYEPVPRTYFQMVRNIGLNGVTNINVFNCGVGKNGQNFGVLNVDRQFSGGSSGKDTLNPESGIPTAVTLTSLDDIFAENKISHCKLLKMDIEGMEYEALYDCGVLPKVEYMVAEFHINQRLEFEGRRVQGLISWVGNRTKLMHVDVCKMAE